MRGVISQTDGIGPVLGTGCTLVIAFAVYVNPLLGVLVTIALAVALVAPRRFCELCCYAFVFLVVVTTPSFVPASISFGGVSMLLYEPFLIIATFGLRAPTRVRQTAAIAYATLLVWGVVTGIVNNNAPYRIYVDVRFQVAIVLTIVLVQKIWHTPILKKSITVFTVALWVSVVVIVVSSTTGLSVNGRTDSGEAALGASRYLTATQYPALAAVCVIFAAVILRRTTLREQWVRLVPALVVLVFAFSRNHVLAVVVVAVVAIALSRTTSSVIRVVWGFAAAVLVVAVLALALPLIPPNPATSWLSDQITTYGARVLSSDDSTDVASSDRDRSNETDAMVRGIASSPIVGHGMGYQYRLPTGEPGQFSYDYAPYYGHNTYIWLYLKTGLVGLALLFTVIGVSLRHLWDRHAGPRSVVGVAFAGFVAIMWVVPLTVGTPESVVLGLMIGGSAAEAASLMRRRAKSPVKQRSFVHRLNPLLNRTAPAAVRVGGGHRR